MKQKQIQTFLFAIVLILGARNGYLALLESEKPVKVYPFQVKYLPISDQKLLQSGIVIHSTAELAQILEDYLS